MEGDLSGVWRRMDIPSGAVGVRLVVDRGKGERVFILYPGGRVGTLTRELVIDICVRVR